MSRHISCWRAGAPEIPRARFVSASEPATGSRRPRRDRQLRRIPAQARSGFMLSQLGWRSPRRETPDGRPATAAFPAARVRSPPPPKPASASRANACNPPMASLFPRSIGWCRCVARCARCSAALAVVMRLKSGRIFYAKQSRRGTEYEPTRAVSEKSLARFQRWEFLVGRLARTMRDAHLLAPTPRRLCPPSAPWAPMKSRRSHPGNSIRRGAARHRPCRHGLTTKFAARGVHVVAGSIRVPPVRKTCLTWNLAIPAPVARAPRKPRNSMPPPKLSRPAAGKLCAAADSIQPRPLTPTSVLSPSAKRGLYLAGGAPASFAARSPARPRARLRSPTHRSSAPPWKISRNGANFSQRAVRASKSPRGRGLRQSLDTFMPDNTMRERMGESRTPSFSERNRGATEHFPLDRIAAVPERIR